MGYRLASTARTVRKYAHFPRQGGQVANDFNLEPSVVSRVHNDLADQAADNGDGLSGNSLARSLGGKLKKPCAQAQGLCRSREVQSNFSS
jgi:hypothetical protein